MTSTRDVVFRMAVIAATMTTASWFLHGGSAALTALVGSIAGCVLIWLVARRMPRKWWMAGK